MSLRTIKEPTLIDPRTLLLFSLPKVGKTEALSQLPNNLIWDFDNSAEYYKNLRVTFDTSSDEKFHQSFVKNYLEAKDDVAKNGKFTFCTIDTITSAYNRLANIMAVKNFNKDEGKNRPLNFDIGKLSYGVGHTYKRDAIGLLIDEIGKLCEILIITGHIGDKSINKESNAIDVADIDLEGKLKNIIAYRIDTIGLFYRSSLNENSIKFTHNNSIAAGARAKHLSGQNIVISELTETKELKTYWEKIFLTLTK